MADYLGTNGDDVLDQVKLGLADWSGIIRGLAGSDYLTGGAIHLQGGPGNDVLTGTSSNTTVNYYDAPSGVIVNLQTGLAQDGWGGQDTLVNIHIVHGSPHADTFLGSAQSDNFWVGAGDAVRAGAGVDTVTVWDQSSRWQVIKLSPQHVQLVQRANGQSVDLVDVEKLQFQDVTINLLFDERKVYQDTTASVLPGAFLFCQAVDLNQDGRWDLVIGGGVFPPSPARETLPLVLMQQTTGNFSRATVAGSLEGFVHPREIASGDFNGDGVIDVVVVGHGYDTAPFPGETPTVLWGQADGSFLDGSEAMPQTPAFTHSVTVADVNRDGFDDVFLGNIWGQQQFTPKLLLGSSTGRFIEAPLPRTVGVDALHGSGTVPVASLLQDINTDGWVDLIAGGGDSGVFFYQGLAVQGGSTTGPFFSERTALPQGRFGAGTITVDIQVMDINRDGLEDLLLSQTNNAYQGRAIQLLVQTEQGQWLDETESRWHGWSATEQWICFVQEVDLNQDGHLDLLASGTSDSSDCVFVNDGTGHFYPAGPSNGVPMLSGSWMLPAEAGKTLAVKNSNDGLISVSAVDIVPGCTGPNWTLPALAGAPGFNEQYYLNHHPDVAASVAAGRIESGLAAYLTLGVSAGHRAYAPGTQVWGSEGLDTVVYAGQAMGYKIRGPAQGGWGITGGSTGNAMDFFRNIERICFADQALALDVTGDAGRVAKTLGAVFGQAAVANKQYVGIGLYFLDVLHYGYTDLMQLAIDARLGPNASHTQVVDLLYTNVVGRAPDVNTRQSFTDLLDGGIYSVASLGQLAAETPLNQANINLVGLAQTGLAYVPFTS